MQQPCQRAENRQENARALNCKALRASTHRGHGRTHAQTCESSQVCASILRNDSRLFPTPVGMARKEKRGRPDLRRAITGREVTPGRPRVEL